MGTHTLYAFHERPLIPKVKRRKMARKLITQLTDDLDGELLGDEGETVLFSLDGRAYEIDLSDAHAQELRAALEPYISAGRRVGAPERTNSRSNGGGSARRSGAYDLTAVREWARSNGHDVKERGRVPSSVIDAYEAAQR
jgi:hypothetical protein